MSTDPRLERLGKLMRLALHNPNEHEARSAALAALRYMDEHKMVVTLYVEPARPAPPPPRQPVPQPESIDNLMAYLRDQMRYTHARAADPFAGDPQDPPDWWRRR